MLSPRFSLVLLGMLAFGGAARAQPASPWSPACAASEDYTVPDEPLQHVAAAIAAGEPLNVLALGSATTVGAATSTSRGSGPGLSFPYRMVEALRAARPQLKVQLTVRGGRGMTAEAMLPLLHEALKEQKYQLVLWQTGTVEAVRGERPDALLAALVDGSDLIQAQSADLVLIDFQFSRFLRANVDLDPYQAVMEQAATMPGVVVFHRYELMHDWVHEDRMDLEHTARADRPKTLALLNTCLGEVLARFVLNGATEK